LTYRWQAIVFLDDNTWRLVMLVINGETMADHPELMATIAAKHGEVPTSPSTPVTSTAKPDMPPKPRLLSYRTWTDSKGRTVEAAFIEHKGPNITLKKRDGKEVTLSIFKLSDEDREWIRQQGK